MKYTLRMYIIENRAIEGLYWSNDMGWGSIHTAQIFTNKNYYLPLDGVWIGLYADEEVAVEEI
jgi:hypothetical protein